jgi:hypothetical protein
MVETMIDRVPITIVGRKVHPTRSQHLNKTATFYCLCQAWKLSDRVCVREIHFTSVSTILLLDSGIALMVCYFV